MNNYAEFISPDRYKVLAKDDPRSIEELKNLAMDNSHCDCGEHVWRLGGCGLCFSCTTGESDASEDYEIGEPYV